MIPFDSIIVPLTAALGLSLIVERVLELAKNILERLIRGADTPVIPDEKEADVKLQHLEQMHKRAAVADSIENEAEEKQDTRKELSAKLDAAEDPEERKALKNELRKDEEDGEWDENISGAEILTVEAIDPDDGKTMRGFILQLLGFALGIGVVHYSGLQLFNSFLAALNFAPDIPEALDYLLTGLLIGGGSAPMHVLVRFVTERKVFTGTDSESSEEEESPKMPGVRPGEEWGEQPTPIRPPEEKQEGERLGIKYRGGVDREQLENVHLRQENPDMVIYHHTAMDSRSTFQDVVKIIKSRTDSHDNHWLTGYNCVVLADGSIHPFCRWDRYGNHAVGFNRRSLGIAFNGNFEPDPDVPGSNPDGALGRMKPTEEQMKAGARVITLWSFLYPIELDFENMVIPHKNVASKACPGSGFLYDDLKAWVEHFREKWENSDRIQAEIEAFRLKPYLYVERRV